MLKKKLNFVPNPNKIAFNLLNNLYGRELGHVSSSKFISQSNTQRLDEIRLSKYRSIPTLNRSVTWLNIDNVEDRFLLAAKCDGNFACVDLFQENTEKKQTFKFIFDSSNLSSSHDHQITCIQWYPIDSGMFFTSGMDQKFKVWDTNTLQVVDEYNLRHKIFNHHVSLLMSTNSKTSIALALDNGQIRLVDINSGSFSHTLKAHPNGYCVAVQWSPTDCNILVSGGSDGRISLWDIRSSKSCLLNFDYENSSKTKKTNIKSSFSGSKAIAHHSSILGLTYTHDGHHIISLGRDSILQLWNASSGINTLVNYGKVPSNQASVETCLQLGLTESCTHKYVFVPSNNNLLMYNIHEGTLKQTFKGHFESINCCCYNPILNEIYTGSKDRNILVWAPEKEEILQNTKKTNNFFTSNNNPFLNTNNKRPHDNWSDEDD